MLKNVSQKSLRTVACVGLMSAVLGVVHAQTSQQAAPPALSMADVVSVLQGAGYTNITEIELEGGKYEAEGRNSAGQEVEVYVDASSGQILDEELEDDDDHDDDSD